MTYTFTYDKLHRVKSKTDSRTGRNLEWSYDAVGNVIEREGYDESDTTLTYDSTNRLVAMSNPDYLGATYHYDGAGRLVDRIFSNGARSRFTWDLDGRLTEVVQTAAAGTQLSRERYCLDAVGNITATLASSTGTCAVPAGDRTAYTYDHLYRLTAEDVTANGATSPKTILSYDAVGNIATAYGDGDSPVPGRTYVVDAANRLTEIRANGITVVRFDYDFEGNRTAKRDPNGVLLESYAYDDKNRLVSLTAGGQTTTYTYDPFDYRIGQTRGTDARLYHLDGEHLDAIYTPTGQPLATYLRGAVIDELVGAYHYDAAGQRTFAAFGHDRLTSVARLADHAGAALQTYTYGPCGADRAGTGTSANRLKYTGREQDPSGFYYYRARYYDPATRRFLSEDPLGFSADVNFYIYASGNPISFNDPLGLFSYFGVEVSGGAGLGGSFQVALAHDPTASLLDPYSYKYLVTPAIGGHAGVDYGVAIVVGKSNADRPQDLSGTSLIIGGSGNIGRGRSAGIDLVFGNQASDGRPYQNVEFSAGRSISLDPRIPLEVHAYVGDTRVGSVADLFFGSQAGNSSTPRQAQIPTAPRHFVGSGSQPRATGHFDAGPYGKNR